MDTILFTENFFFISDNKQKALGTIKWEGKDVPIWVRIDAPCTKKFDTEEDALIWLSQYNINGTAIKQAVVSYAWN